MTRLYEYLNEDDNDSDFIEDINKELITGVRTEYTTKREVRNFIKAVVKKIENALNK